MDYNNPVRSLRLAPAAAGFALLSLLSNPVQAVEFELLEGEVTGSLDTSVSYGAMWRVQGQDKSHGSDGTGNDDINANDGNRNFDTGLVSQVFKVTADLETNYKNYGFFVRGTAFYDTEIMDKRNDYLDNNSPWQPSQTYPRQNTFPQDTRDVSGHDAEILDSYLYGDWEFDGIYLNARVGKQVINWGEGIFYRNGINTTNPLDAAKFRLPGSELKEALIPVETLYFNLGLTDNLSMEAFYQWNWKETRIDPVGTYFSETDLFADGGQTAYTEASSSLSTAIAGYKGMAAGTGPLAGLRPFFTTGGFNDGSFSTLAGDPGSVLKVADIKSDLNAKNDGQWGINFRYIVEELNDTEFGFYFVNYHSKEPVIYASLDDAYAQGLDMGSIITALGGGASAITTAGGLATVDLAGQVEARREYVEDIRMYGISFNTSYGNTSFAGEMAYRPNMPIGISTTNDLLGDLLLQAPDIADNSNTVGDGCGTIAGKTLCRTDQLHNYERVESYNLSLSAIHNFGPSVGFDSLFGIVEVASEHLRGSSLSYQDFNGNSRYYAGRGDVSYADCSSVNENCDEYQADKNAWGYNAVLSGTWNDVLAGVNLNPIIRYTEDVSGNSHRTGNFIEGRKAYTVAMRAVYLNNLEAEIQYTDFFGGGRMNSTRDRDNIGVNVRYSF